MKEEIKILRGNEKDCICEKPKGKHRKHCDAYRLQQFLIYAARIKNENKIATSN